MKIKHKYNCGDELWYLDKDDGDVKIQKVTIITISKCSNYLYYNSQFFIEQCEGDSYCLRENDLFTTVDSAAKSLETKQKNENSSRTTIITCCKYDVSDVVWWKNIERNVILRGEIRSVHIFEGSVYYRLNVMHSMTSFYKDCFNGIISEDCLFLTPQEAADHIVIE